MSGPALEAKELYRFYHTGEEETFALRGVTIEVQPGHIVAVTGPSGSGKSTLLACVAGLDEPDGGSVRIAGERITRQPENVKSAIRNLSLGILLQHQNLLEHLSVLQNIELVQHLATHDRPVKDPHEIIDSVGLGARAHAKPSTLSGGEAARAGLAVAIANDPPVLLADEPTAEVDQDNELVLLELLRMRAAEGCAVLVVTHSERVASAAEHIYRLRDGKMIDG